MNEQIVNYINSQRIAVLAVEMPDGSPHAATIHFGNVEDPMRFIILTEKTTRKCESIIANGKCRASLVLGQDTETMQTLQMDGTLESTTDEAILNAYLQKFPNMKDRSEDPDGIVLVFTPTWWRYSDYKAAGGPQIITNKQR